MAKKVTKSEFASEMGGQAKKAISGHKDDETKTPGGAALPAGIENGIARLEDFRIARVAEGRQNAGKWQLVAGAIVAQPLTHKGIPIEGLRTGFTEPLYATPKRGRKTVDEHLAWVINLMRLLGVDTSEWNENDPEEIERAAQMLMEEKPYLRFRTWQGEPTEQYPNPMVNHVWLGACDYEVPEEDDVEEGDEEEETEGEEVEENDQDDDREEESPEDDDTEDVYALGKLADGGNDEAALRLTELAEEAGMETTSAEFNSMTWGEVANALTEADDGAEEDEDEEETEEETEEEAGDDDDEEEDEEEEEEEDEEEEEEEETGPPEKENFYFFKPKGSKRRIEGEVVSVNKAKETVSIKDLTTGKLYKSVPWASLEEE